MVILSGDALLEIFGYASATGDESDVRWLLCARAVSTDWREAARLGIEREWAAERARTAAGGFTLRLLPPIAEWRRTHGTNDALALSRLYRAITTVRSVFELDMEELRKSVTLLPADATPRRGRRSAVCSVDPPWAFSDWRDRCGRGKGVGSEPQRQLSVVTSHRASGGSCRGRRCAATGTTSARTPSPRVPGTRRCHGWRTASEYHVAVGAVAAGPPLPSMRCRRTPGAVRGGGGRSCRVCAHEREVCLWLGKMRYHPPFSPRKKLAPVMRTSLSALC